VCQKDLSFVEVFAAAAGRAAADNLGCVNDEAGVCGAGAVCRFRDVLNV
jgi:hypothetical protein